MVDYGIVFGLSGLLVAFVSLAYSHAQAGAARRQADAEAQLARIEVNNVFADRVRNLRTRIVTTPHVAREYGEANPHLAAVSQQIGGLETVAVLRDFLDATQEMYFLRRDGYISDHDWRGWVTSAIPIARMPSVRAIFENGITRQAFDPAFVGFFRPFVEGGLGEDPLRRVVLPQASPTPAAEPPRPT